MRRVTVVILMVSLLFLSSCRSGTAETGTDGVVGVVPGNGVQDQDEEGAVSPELAGDDSENYEKYEIDPDLYEDTSLDRISYDWYDRDGSLLWRGLTDEEIKNISESERARFDAVMERLDNYSMPVSENESIPGVTGDLRAGFSNLCFEYDDLIPFAEGGRFYGEGFDKCVDGFDNTFYHSNGIGYGMDATGYIIWLYRNTFGQTPCDMEDLYELSLSCPAVEAGELQIGDICMLTDEPGKNHFGVIAYIDNGVPLISHCDNTYSERFPLGATRLSYLASVKNEYFGSSAPVDFKYFFRVVEDWGDRE